MSVDAGFPPIARNRELNLGLEGRKGDGFLLTIIMVNYETTIEVGSIIRSFVEHSPPFEFNTEFFVIDNNSRIYPIESLRIPPSCRDIVTVIKNRENLGYAPAASSVSNQVKGDLVLFLNPDVIPGDWSWLSDLVEFMMCREDVGAAAPLIFSSDGKVFLGGSYNFWLPTIRLCERTLDRDTIELVSSKRVPLAYPWVSGASLLTRRALFKELGGF